MNLDFKKALATGASILMLLGNATVAFAGAEADAGVVDDGTATSESFDNDSFTVDNENNGGVVNIDAGVGISGLNTQSDNDDDNSMETGDSEGMAESENFLNSNVTEIATDDEEGSAHAGASVGEDGSAEATAKDNDEVTVENDNDGSVVNLTLGLAISGLNTQDGNDDDNMMVTGDSDASAESSNEVNSNWTMIGGSHSAHAMAEVGDDGSAEANATDNDEVTVDNDNDASLTNVSLAAAVSGGNSQSGNDDENSMETGGSTAEASANNFVNSNVTVVGDSEGGSADASAEVGEDGSAEATAKDNDEVTVENSNEADVTNVSAGVAVSGGNTQSDNDDGNTMTTGNSSGSACSSNTVNSNWTSIGSSLPEGGEGGCN